MPAQETERDERPGSGYSEAQIEISVHTSSKIIDYDTLTVKVLENEHMSIFIKDSEGRELFIEEMDMNLARKIRDFLNYAIKG